MIPQEGLAVARAVRDAFGGTGSVNRYYDEDESHHVDVLTALGAPVAGYRAMSTLGLFTAPNPLDGRDVPIELAAVGAAREERWENLLASTAFFVAKDRWFAGPGVVFPGVAQLAGLSVSMPHAVLMPPAPWPSLGSVRVTDELSVHWLLVFPISDGERRLIEDGGFFAFEEALERANVSYWDLDRHPVA